MLRQGFKIFLAILTVCCSIWYKDKLQNVWDTYLVPRKIIYETEGIKVFSQEELSHYNGEGESVYLAVLGKVFDVTKGSQHYAKGAPYNYFTGKDGSRALITGDFYDETKNKDHILDLKCVELFTILTWQDTFQKKYLQIGVLDGRYYNNLGHKTSYSKEVDIRIEKCKEEKEINRKQELEHPPCNIAWSADEGTKVWCTKTSGGISRSWVGVPRQFYMPDEDKPYCVCVNTKKGPLHGQFKEYDNCPSDATSCIVNN